VYNSYYQWVPLYLIFLAVIFYLPRYIVNLPRYTFCLARYIYYLPRYTF
jgi:hypothetical protein